MNINVVYVLLVVMIGFGLALSIFSSGTASRVAFEEQLKNVTESRPSIVTISGKPVSVGPLGPENCPITGVTGTASCSYPIKINGLVLKATNSTSNLAVAMTYKEKSLIVPCKPRGQAGTGIAQGPCTIDQLYQGVYTATFDFSALLTSEESTAFGKGALTTPDIPPTINANTSTHYDNMLLYNGQRLILGNFSFYMTVRQTTVLYVVPNPLKNAQATISCKSESKIIDFNEGDDIFTVMCGTDVNMKLVKKSTTVGIVEGGKWGFFDISVGTTPGETVGDQIFLSFWLYDSEFRTSKCGGLENELRYYGTQMKFDATAALVTQPCTNKFLGGGVVYAPISTWDPNVENIWQPLKLT